MSRQKLKVIVLTHGGAGRLLELLSACGEVEIVGVYVETSTHKQKSFAQKLKRSIRYDGYLATFRKFGARIFGTQTNGAGQLQSVRAGQIELEELAEELRIPFFWVEDYHAASSEQLLRAADPDLGILYGTNIIDERIFSIPKKGSINIHLGLTPYYRGGPSVFWELFNGEVENGVTVHFVATKVDAGDVILQRTFPLEYDFEKYGLDYESFLTNHRDSLKEPMAEMLVEAVKMIAAGKVRTVEQDLSLGKRYRLPLKKDKDSMIRILKKRRDASGY